MTCGFVVQILPISIPISSQIWCLFMYFFLEDILFYVCLCYVLATYLPSLLLFPLLFVPCGAVVTRAVHGLISIGRISIFHGLAQSSLLKYSIRCRAGLNIDAFCQNLVQWSMNWYNVIAKQSIGIKLTLLRDCICKWRLIF